LDLALRYINLQPFRRPAQMNAAYEISLATPDDVAGILALQEPNLPENGGSLSVRQPAEWFKRATAEKSLIVCRRNGEVVGYVLGTSLAVKAHIPIVQAMLRAFPALPDCYLYGPICIAKAERGNGLAVAMFKELQAHMGGRPAMTFIRADNASSRQAHRKMGMHELGTFNNEGAAYIALSYSV
jgi:Acetyltransferase (GNAT) family